MKNISILLPPLLIITITMFLIILSQAISKEVKHSFMIKAEGELNVNDVLNIKSEGNVNGKIFYGEIQIEEGGKLSREINHRDKNNKQEEFKDLKVS